MDPPGHQGGTRRRRNHELTHPTRMDPAPGTHEPSERDFDALPEALRLALLEAARLEIGAPPLNLPQIAAATGTPYTTVHRRLTVALMKMRRRAAEMGIDPHG